MNPFTLFTTYRGRIPRLGFWIGLIILTAVSPFTFGAIFSANPFKEAMRVARDLGPVGLIWSLVLLVAMSMLMIKRLHDRGQSGALAALFYAPAALKAVTLFTGNLPLLKEATLVSNVLAWWIGASGLWFLIQLGLFPGDKGPNKYGADPRGRTHAS